MFVDNKDFAFFVTILVAAIAISILFHIFFSQNIDVGLSELYFPDPDNLPNDVLLGNNYNFSFMARNLEGRPDTYNYNAQLQLFNLYDVTEGIYRCIVEQRKKVFLTWVYANESNASLILENEITGYDIYDDLSLVSRRITIFENPPIYSKSDDYGRIDLPYYTVDYSIENIFETGSFTTIFHDSDRIKYYFTIYSDTDEVKFVYFEGNTTKSEIKKVENLKPNNRILINATDSLRYYIDNKLIFDKKIPDITNGKFDFRIDNGIIMLNRLVIYKDSPLEVTKSGYVRQYDIDNSLIIPKIEEYRKSYEEYIPMVSYIANFTKECENEECDKFKSFLNNPQDAYSIEFEEGINETDIISLIDVKDTIVTTDNLILPNTTINKLFWENFTLRMDFQLFVKQHTFLLNFDGRFMVLFHNANIYFINKEFDRIRVYRRRSTVELGVNEIAFESKGYNTIVYINNLPIFNIQKELNMERVTIHTKNTFVIFSDIFISNKDDSCKETEAVCKRIFNVPSQRQISQRREVIAIANPLRLSVAIGAAPIIGAAELLKQDDFKQLLKNESQNASLLDISELIDYGIDIEPLTANSNIPSEKYIFDGANARLANLSNYTFSFDFYLLEGAGLIETSFYNNDGTKSLTFIANEPKEEIYILTHNKGSLIKDTISFNISIKEQYRFSLEFESGKVKYMVNRRNVFESDGIDLSNGFFSITTYNTYADLIDITFYDRNTKMRIPFVINKDPCSLKKIYEINLENGHLYLDNKENKTIFKSFSINKDFDYGLVSVTLHQENRNESEIHFWVVKND